MSVKVKAKNDSGVLQTLNCSDDGILKIIDINDIEKYTDKLKVGSAGALSTYTTETAPIQDDNNRNGWMFHKQIANADKINWFFYGAGNTYTTYGDLKSISCLLTIDTYTAVNSIPFFIVYTTPTGSNDYSWYKSKITYRLSAGQIIHLGEEIQAYCGIKPKQQSNKRLVEFNITNTDTLGSDTSIEELYSISIHTDSGAGINTKVLVRQVGFDLYDGINKIERRINLVH